MILQKKNKNSKGHWRLCGWHVFRAFGGCDLNWSTPQSLHSFVLCRGEKSSFDYFGALGGCKPELRWAFAGTLSTPGDLLGPLRQGFMMGEEMRIHSELGSLPTVGSG